MKTPQKLLGLDFDLTLTRLHIFRDKKLRVSKPSREARLHAMPESDEDECEDEYKDEDVDQETLEVFGGWGRLMVLRRWLRWLKERHVATVIFSANFKDRIELAMAAVGLLQFFQISGTDDDYHHHYLVGPNGKEITVALGRNVLRSSKRDHRRGHIRDDAAAAEGKAAAMRKVMKHYNLQPKDGLFLDDRPDVQVSGL
jgi:phosphoglycolate phosphatase-like HAD superfamily hydrolase